MNTVRVREDGRIEGDLDAVARLVGRAGRAVALTGAGISVESGIPDFRSPNGLWTVFDPMEYATLSCFLRAPDRAWELYRALGAVVAGKRPNPAHRALAQLEADGLLAGVVTQNIDGLHQAAGSRNVLEIHGRGDTLHCLSCGRTEPLRPAHLEPGPVPRCACGAVLKPTIVLFEEPVRAMPEIERLLAGADLLLVVGTSAQVVPACLLPQWVRSSGGRVIEFNVEPALGAAALGPEGTVVHGPAGVSLPLVAGRAMEAHRAMESR